MIDIELVTRMRRRLNVEITLLTGLSQQIIEASRELVTLGAQAASARQRAQRYPDRFEGMSPDERNQYLNERQEARFSERRRVIAQAQEVGADPEPILRELGLFADNTDRSEEFVTAAADAEAAYKRAEQQLQELEAERSARGRIVGELRASLQRFDLWSRTNGQHAMKDEEAA